MMIKRTNQEVFALEAELLGDGGHRLTLIDGTVVNCVALKLGRGFAHVFTSRGVRAKYRYADIFAARVLDDVKEIDALVEAMQLAGLIRD